MVICGKGFYFVQNCKNPMLRIQLLTIFWGYIGLDYLRKDCLYLNKFPLQKQIQCNASKVSQYFLNVCVLNAHTDSTSIYESLSLS